MVKVRVRLYVLDPETIFRAVGQPPEQHSYCIGADQGGLSSVLGTFNVDDRRCQFAEMRRMIDFQFNDGMTRRTMLYQEIQCWARASPNHASWPAGNASWPSRAAKSQAWRNRCSSSAGRA